MKAEAYDAWYESPRGRWIGGLELEAVQGALAPGASDSLLDVGCGTGHFTRGLAAERPGRVVGLDLDAEWLAHARGRDAGGIRWVLGDARALPFPDHRFDLVMSITALCFVEEERLAVREMVRVARRRVVLGLMNRHSLLWWQKGQRGGQGAYRGARWHTAARRGRFSTPCR